jgi:hypothetical protein
MRLPILLGSVAAVLALTAPVSAGFVNLAGSNVVEQAPPEAATTWWRTSRTARPPAIIPNGLLTPPLWVYAWPNNTAEGRKSSDNAWSIMRSMGSPAKSPTTWSSFGALKHRPDDQEQSHDQAQLKTEAASAVQIQ